MRRFTEMANEFDRHGHHAKQCPSYGVNGSQCRECIPWLTLRRLLLGNVKTSHWAGPVQARRTVFEPDLRSNLDHEWGIMYCALELSRDSYAIDKDQNRLYNMLAHWLLEIWK